MKKLNQIFIILILTFYASCAQDKIKSTKIIINAEKCKEWNLPEVNFKSEIPKEYILSFAETGGYYFQAKKYGEDNKLLVEISVGQIDGDLKINDENIMSVLKQTNDGLNKMNIIESLHYETSFIGESKINGYDLKHLRGSLEFNNYDKSIDGKYYSFITPFVQNDKNQIMISSIFRETEKLNNENISLEVLDFLSSIKFTD